MYICLSTQSDIKNITKYSENSINYKIKKKKCMHQSAVDRA